MVNWRRHDHRAKIMEITTNKTANPTSVPSVVIGYHKTQVKTGECQHENCPKHSFPDSPDLGLMMGAIISRRILLDGA